MVGDFARSKAGHDQNKLYIIAGEDGEYVYLTDGDTRPLEKTKRKNKKHIQIAYHSLSAGVKEKLASGREIRNEEIKRAIKLYEAENQI